ncbi:MFS transporter [Streptomyces sp. NBC_00075]|uniref:MFS transporter n=1 Tax=Streptomyces sp. NBC_00075 TaxID=2975641 RepID=UPI00324C9678
MLVSNLPSSLYGALSTTLGFDVTVSSWLYAAYFATLVPSLLAAGRIRERVRPAVLLRSGLALCLAGEILSAVAGSAAGIGVARALQGIVVGVLSVFLSSLALHSAPVRGVGLSAGSTLIGGIVGPAIGACWIAFDRAEPSGAFGIAVVLIAAVLAASFFVRLPVAPLSARSVQRVAWRDAPREGRRAVLAGCLSSVAAWTSAGLVLGLLTNVLPAALPTAPQWLAPVLVTSVMTMALGTQLGIGRLLPSGSRVPLAFAGTVASTLGASLLAAGLWTGSTPLVVVAVVAIGCGLGAGFLGGLRLVSAVRAELPSGLDRFFLLSYVAAGAPALVVGLLGIAIDSVSALGLVLLTSAVTTWGTTALLSRTFRQTPLFADPVARRSPSG